MVMMNFFCVVCQDQVYSNQFLVGLDHWCQDCIVEGIIPKFLDALVNELAYPPHVGEARLDVHDFLELLPPGFSAAWTLRMREYAVDPSHRLYCPHRVVRAENVNVLDICNTFIPPSVEFAYPHHDWTVPIGQCTNCHQRSCHRCRGAVFQNSHTCTFGTPQDPFAELTQGRDYQVCPNTACALRIQLRDGCNHITCPCRTHFCFVCGVRATAGSGHWSYGMPCPRYNQPDAAAAAPAPPPPIDEVVQELHNTLNRFTNIRQMFTEAAQRADQQAALPPAVATAEEVMAALEGNLRQFQAQLTGTPGGLAADANGFWQRQATLHGVFDTWDQGFNAAFQAVGWVVVDEPLEYVLETYANALHRVRADVELPN